MVKEMILKWLGLQEEIDQMVKERSEKIAKQLTEEKEAAIAALSKQHGEEIANLKKQISDSLEAAEKEKKQYATLQERLNKYKELGQRITHNGPGRPRLNRVPFNLQIDGELKEAIAILEQAGIIKRGAVTAHINEYLWAWLKPLREQLMAEAG